MIRGCRQGSVDGKFLNWLMHVLYSRFDRTWGKVFPQTLSVWKLCQSVIVGFTMFEKFAVKSPSVYQKLLLSGLLIIRAVADPQISGFFAKSAKIKWNTAKSARNISKYMSAKHISYLSWLYIRPVLFTPNVQIYLETSSLQRVNNIPKLPGVFR